MENKKYMTLNASPLEFAMSEMWAGRIPGSPDGKTPPRMGHIRRRRAVEYRDGGVEFNVYAPDAQTVEVSGTQMTRMGQEKHALHPVGEGWWQTFVPGTPGGIQYLYYYFDGKERLYEHAPVSYGHNRVCNFIDVPDPNCDFYDFKDVPHGAVRCEYYYSDFTGALRSCWVYTPPKYDVEPEKRYPVLFLQHGGGENETGWFWQGKINLILDNLIAEGKCEEMIVVSNYGHAYAPDSQYEGMLPGDIGKVITEDCLPFIDRRFRTIPDKAHRALAGLSMGSFQTQWFAFNNPEWFDYIGIFSGRVGNFENVRTDHFTTAENAELFNSQHKLLYYSRGRQEGDPLEPEMEELRAKGIRVEYFTCEGIHEWQTWRWSAYDFAQKLFRE